MSKVTATLCDRGRGWGGRGRDPEKFALGKLAEISDGFISSELEEAAISGFYEAFYEGRDLSEKDLVAAIKDTVPYRSPKRRRSRRSGSGDGRGQGGRRRIETLEQLPRRHLLSRIPRRPRSELGPGRACLRGGDSRRWGCAGVLFRSSYSTRRSDRRPVSGGLRAGMSTQVGRRYRVRLFSPPLHITILGNLLDLSRGRFAIGQAGDSRNSAGRG